MIALGTIALGVVVQTVATRDAGADQNVHANDFGVRLLETELSAPVSTTVTAALPPTVAEPASLAATFLAPFTERQPLLEPAATRERSWLSIFRSELGSAETQTDRSLDPRLSNRDSAGSLIEITENDVLIPVRLGY
jgi:hypothetical protein